MPVNEAAMMESNGHTIKRWAFEWVKNILVEKNLGLETLEITDEQSNLPIVVAGGGPSLEKRIAWLKKYPTFVIANQSSLLRLLYSGIQPQIVLVMDSQEIVIHKIKVAQKEFGWKGKIVAATHCSKELEKTKKPSVYWFKSPMIHETPEGIFLKALLDNTSPGVDTWMLQAGCVGNASVLLANYFLEKGFFKNKLVYLTGIDYCFEGDLGHCYTWKGEREGLVEVETDKDDETFFLGGYKTTKKLMFYRNDLEFIIQHGVKNLRLLDKGFLSDFIELAEFNEKGDTMYKQGALLLKGGQDEETERKC